MAAGDAVQWHWKDKLSIASVVIDKRKHNHIIFSAGVTNEHGGTKNAVVATAFGEVIQV